jgi:hypothetical protein
MNEKSILNKVRTLLGLEVKFGNYDAFRRSIYA